eukprot:XP_001704042.1 Hypothetical protein GL50803_38201 [Giardia lamblia ATCC 50803]
MPTFTQLLGKQTLSLHDHGPKNGIAWQSPPSDAGVSRPVQQCEDTHKTRARREPHHARRSASAQGRQ